MKMLTSGLLFSQLRSGSYRLTPRVLCQSSLRNYSLLAQRGGRSHILRTSFVTVPTRYISQSSEKVAALSPSPDSASLATGDVSAVSDVSTSATDAATEATSSLAEAVTAHTPGLLQYGDLAAMGLASWTPAGIIRWSFELINVTTELPWFWTIVAGSLFWRLVLVPITVKGLKNSSRLLPIQPQIQIHQAAIEKAKAKKDTIALQSEAIKMQKLYKEAGVNLFTGFLVPVVQVPVSLGLFFGVRTLCNEVPQLAAYSGLDILPNLAVPDPYYILPALLCAAINAQVVAGAGEMNTSQRPEAAHFLNALRLLSVIGIFVMGHLPSGLMVALVTTSTASALQSLALRMPAVRNALGIRPIPKGSDKLPSFMASARFAIEKYKSKIEEAKLEAAKRQKFQAGPGQRRKL